jgi:anti-sigma factor RsiW
MAGLICRLVRRRLTEYLDQEISAKARRGVEHHLTSCEQCQKLLSRQREEYAVAELVVRRPAPAGFTERTMARLQREVSPAKQIRRSRPLPLKRMAWATAALAVLVVLAGRFALMPSKAGLDKTPNTIAAPATGNATVLTASELLELGTLQEENGQLEDALTTYQSAAEYKETRSDALFAAGRVYEELGFPTAALEAFDKALSQQAAPADRRDKDENV